MMLYLNVYSKVENVENDYIQDGQNDIVKGDK